MRSIQLVILSFMILVLIKSSGSCDYILQMTSADMGTFKAAGYNPLYAEAIFDKLNSLRASILTTYQLCFGKIIPDPDSLYPQDVAGCFAGLYNVSLLTGRYNDQPARIKSQIDSISKIVFSTQINCNPVLHYKPWNITDDCKAQIQPLDDLFIKYDDEIIMGKNGLSYINPMILQSEKVRKFCGFNILVKANTWKEDTCKAANNQWLYPLTDQIDTLLLRSKYSNFTALFYNLYQGLYRVKTVCNVTMQESSSSIIQKNNKNPMLMKDY